MLSFVLVLLIVVNVLLTVAQAMPVTGAPVPELTSFDKAMIILMVSEGIPIVGLAVAKDGRLVLPRGYGYAD